MSKGIPVGRFSFGQVVLAYFSDGNGRTKERPCVIISSNRSNDSGESLQIIAIIGESNRVLLKSGLPPFRIVGIRA